MLTVATAAGAGDFRGYPHGGCQHGRRATRDIRRYARFLMLIPDDRGVRVMRYSARLPHAGSADRRSLLPMCDSLRWRLPPGSPLAAPAALTSWCFGLASSILAEGLLGKMPHLLLHYVPSSQDSKAWADCSPRALAGSGAPAR